MRLFDIKSYIVPSPGAVATVLVDRAGFLAENSWTTLVETVAGFALTVVGGVLIGALLSASRWVEQAFSPVLVALNAIPKLTFSPLLIVWIGFGRWPKIIMVILVCFFPVVLSTVTGLTSTPNELVDLAQSLCGSRLQTFVKIRLKAALPQMFLGFKTAMPLAVIGAVVAELFGADKGLGYIVQSSPGDTAPIFAAIALLAVMSIALFYLVVLVERLLLPWVRKTVS